jgi:hypothetical protein
LGQNIKRNLLDVPNEELSTLKYRDLLTRYGLEDSHINEFTADSFIRLLEKCGFEVLTIDYTNDYKLKSPVFKALLRLNLFIQKIKNSRMHQTSGRFSKILTMHLYERLEKKHHVIAMIRRSGNN